MQQRFFTLSFVDMDGYSQIMSNLQFGGIKTTWAFLH